MKRCIPLEPAAEEVCCQSSVPPLIFRLPPEQGRQALEKAQDTPVYKCPADISSAAVDCGKWGVIPVYFVVPKCSHTKNVILYIHGGGWVFGSFHTHEKLVRELASRTNSMVVFPEYSLAPEAKYPVAVEQCYYVLSHLCEIIGKRFPDARCDLPIVAGDSAGGNIAIAMVIMSNMRSGPHIQKLLLYYPITNACFDTPSYRKFAVNYYLYREGMIWFWRQYAPCPKTRDRITISPLKAGLDCLCHFPPTIIVNGQADVLRSEGETFGERLRCAGVDVTALSVQGTIHDFVMLNSLDQTAACRIAMDASTEWINRNEMDTFNKK